MEILSKIKMDDIFGKYSFFSGKAGNTIIEKVQYMGGIDSVDSLISKASLAKDKYVSFEIRPNGLEIFIMNNFETIRLGLFSEQIKYWSIEHQEEITTKKSKSVLGRALLGGILLGPAGAIVGGLTGVGDKTIKLSDVDNILSINYVEAEKEAMILFSVKNKNLKTVMEYYKKNYPNIYKTADELKEESVQPNNTFSVADEILKLRSLMENGIITQEEFNEQKSKLLNM